MSEDRVTYNSGSGKVMGIITVSVAVVAAALALFDHSGGRPAYEVVCLAVFFGTLGWAAMLRPTITVGREDLVLRNMLETVTIPLAAVESVTVRQVLVIRAGEKKITSSAIGRSRRQITRDARPAGSGSGFGSLFQLGGGGGANAGGDAGAGTLASSPRGSYGLLVEEQLRSHAKNARLTVGVEARSPEQAALAEGIERRPAVPEIALLAVSLVAFVVLLVVA
ncbi:hypothetical protein BH11ACT8_BH11ACT8_10850 [soil metagenome]